MCCFQWVILVVFLVCFVSLKFVIHTSADEPFWTHEYSWAAFMPNTFWQLHIGLVFRSLWPSLWPSLLPIYTATLLKMLDSYTPPSIIHGLSSLAHARSSAWSILLLAFANICLLFWTDFSEFLKLLWDSRSPFPFYWLYVIGMVCLYICFLQWTKIPFL